MLDHILPLFFCQQDFITAGYSSPLDISIVVPVCNKWSLQVTGLDANGANVAAEAWDVTLQASNDGVGYDGDTTTAMLRHVSGTNADGAVVKSNGNLMPVRRARVHVVSVTLGSATKIRVTAVGDR